MKTKLKFLICLVEWWNERYKPQPNQLFCFLFFSSLSNEKKEENKQELKGLAALVEFIELPSLVCWAARLGARRAAPQREDKQEEQFNWRIFFFFSSINYEWNE